MNLRRRVAITLSVCLSLNMASLHSPLLLYWLVMVRCQDVVHNCIYQKRNLPINNHKSPPNSTWPSPVCNCWLSQFCVLDVHQEKWEVGYFWVLTHTTPHRSLSGQETHLKSRLVSQDHYINVHIINQPTTPVWLVSATFFTEEVNLSSRIFQWGEVLQFLRR